MGTNLNINARGERVVGAAASALRIGKAAVVNRVANVEIFDADVARRAEVVAAPDLTRDHHQAQFVERAIGLQIVEISQRTRGGLTGCGFELRGVSAVDDGQCAGHRIGHADHSHELRRRGGREIGAR